MILSSMSRDEKKQEAMATCNKLNRISRSGFVAGGYLRDIYMDSLPKDIDFFLPMGRFDTPQARANVAERLFAAVNQRGRRVENTGAYLTSMNNNDPRTFEIWEMADTDWTHEPLNLIFDSRIGRGSDNAFHFVSSNFDLYCCMIFKAASEPTWNMPYHFVVDTRGGIIRLNERAATYNGRMINHIERIKQRYPNWTLMLPPTFLSLYPDLYQQLVYSNLIGQGGVNGEDPRQVLPDETQELDWDEVRLDAGTVVGPAAPVEPTTTVRLFTGDRTAFDSVAGVFEAAQIRGDQVRGAIATTAARAFTLDDIGGIF